MSRASPEHAITFSNYGLIEITKSFIDLVLNSFVNCEYEQIFVLFTMPFISIERLMRYKSGLPI